MNLYFNFNVDLDNKFNISQLIKVFALNHPKDNFYVISENDNFTFYGINNLKVVNELKDDFNIQISFLDNIDEDDKDYSIYKIIKGINGPIFLGDFSSRNCEILKKYAEIKGFLSFKKDFKFKILEGLDINTSELETLNEYDGICKIEDIFVDKSSVIFANNLEANLIYKTLFAINKKNLDSSNDSNSIGKYFANMFVRFQKTSDKQILSPNDYFELCSLLLNEDKIIYKIPSNLSYTQYEKLLKTFMDYFTLRETN